MKIEYFLLKEEETEEFLAFETIHENPELKNFYEKKEKQLLLKNWIKQKIICHA